MNWKARVSGFALGAKGRVLKHLAPMDGRYSFSNGNRRAGDASNQAIHRMSTPDTLNRWQRSERSWDPVFSVPSR